MSHGCVGLAHPGVTLGCRAVSQFRVLVPCPSASSPRQEGPSPIPRALGISPAWGWTLPPSHH